MMREELWKNLPDQSAGKACQMFSNIFYYQILNLVGEPDVVQPYLDAVVKAFEHRNVIQYNANEFCEAIRNAIIQNRCEAFKSKLRGADLLVVTDDGMGKSALNSPSVQLQIKTTSLERKLLGKQTLLVTSQPVELYGELRELWFQCVTVNVKEMSE